MKNKLITDPAMHVVDAGVMAYREAWELQLRVLGEVLEGKHPRGALILVEHLPVVTIGRRQEARGHLLASPKMLEMRGVEVVETDRGGDITFHGPGQLVAYPIVPLNAYGFNLHSYMRFLEGVVIGTVAEFGVEAMRDTSPCAATGVWVRDPAAKSGGACEKGASGAEGLAKIAALGIKVRRWVSFHGLALNVTTDLSFFDLINPCGLSRPVTSMERVLGGKGPDVATVKRVLGRVLERDSMEVARLQQVGPEGNGGN